MVLLHEHCSYCLCGTGTPDVAFDDERPQVDLGNASLYYSVENGSVAHLYTTQLIVVVDETSSSGKVLAVSLTCGVHNNVSQLSKVGVTSCCRNIP